MAKEDSGLGWLANEGTICSDTNNMCTISLRQYYKTNSTPAIVVICKTSGYTEPHLASTDIEAVRYTTSIGGDMPATHTYVINGVTWYFNIGGYGWAGVVPSYTRFPYVDADYQFDTIDNAIDFLNLVGVEYTNTYTVQFNANGGSGTMADQTIQKDTPTALNPNTFTKENYMFTGWGTNPEGPVIYTDGEVVTNLAEVNETITLYAVWQVAPMSIILQYNASENNKLDKTLTTITTLYGQLRSETSIIDPVILLGARLDSISGANYITIPKFNRSYFIRNMRSIRTDLTEISCHVDVLTSFKDEIRENNAVIHKQENLTNLYLNDGTFRVTQKPDIFTVPFPTGFSTQEFVLAVAGAPSTP